jgi:metallophosphoesterase (TIGR00282 family)
MNVLVVGDIVGQSGVTAFCQEIGKMKAEYSADVIIVNGENSERGSGINKDIFYSLINAGADVVTLGNHTWGKKDIFSFIDSEPRLIRPLNYAEDLVGKGSVIIEKNGVKIGVINLIGRINMGGSFDCPFKTAEKEIEKLKNAGAGLIIIDFHAEATAEKKALAYYLKDKANIIFGTHTHVQTNDEEIYDSGMGYITDIGMTGPYDSIIGMDKEIALKRFLTQIPERYQVAEGPNMINAVLFKVNDATKKVENIEKIIKKDLHFT